MDGYSHSPTRSRPFGAPQAIAAGAETSHRRNAQQRGQAVRGDAAKRMPQFNAVASPRVFLIDRCPTRETYEKDLSPKETWISGGQF
jgi:hypothetical protein